MKNIDFELISTIGSYNVLVVLIIFLVHNERKEKQLVGYIIKDKRPSLEIMVQVIKN
jgi:hypothetical protein